MLLRGEHVKKILILFNLVFLLILTACQIDEETIKDIINQEQIEEIISSLDTENKIFLNVVDKDKMYVPLEKNGEKIIWEYDKEFFSLNNNQFKIKKDGLTIISATYKDKTHLYSVTIKNDSITNTVQYNLNFYYSFISDNKKIGKKITPDTIVFHNTANTAPAVNEVKWLNSNENKSSTSFHYAVDDIGVYQAIPTTNASYHAGNLEINNRSIGIEIAKSMKENIEEKNLGINNSLLLIILLMNYYDISIKNIITHQDASGKYCPHDIFDRYGVELFYEELLKLT